MLSFKSVGLDSGLKIDSKAVEMYLHPGDLIDAKITKVNHQSCIVHMKLHLSKDDGKQYLAENYILARYGLVDAKTFKVVHEEDFPFNGMSLEDLKKSSQIKFGRNTSYRFFRNWSVFDCRKELESNDELDVIQRLLSISSDHCPMTPFSSCGESAKL